MAEKVKNLEADMAKKDLEISEMNWTPPLEKLTGLIILTQI